MKSMIPKIINLILDTDSYKFVHWLQYPEGTKHVFSYMEARVPFIRDNKPVFFGLQYILKKYLCDPITKADVEEARDFAIAHGEAFNYEGWMYIVNELNGKLPIEIRAVKEGTKVPIKNALITVTNTDDKCAWLVGYLETMLLRVWYPCTVASNSNKFRQIVKMFCEETCDNPAVDMAFKVHDFGSRGCSCQEQAMIGGMSHLVNFNGSDTVVGVWAMNQYYNQGKMSGFSIPASEHSTITVWGKEGEADAYRNMLEKNKEFPIIACVSDSYDIFNACENIWGGELKALVEERDGILVVRPDSGDPVKTPIRCVEILAEKFGYTINEKGYKVLKNVKVIQGDNVDPNVVLFTLATLKEKGFSAECINFGSGGGLLIKDLNRDSYGYSFKNCAIDVNGEWRDVCKTPLGSEMKKSKAGRLMLVKEDGEYKTIKIEDNVKNLPNELEVVYRNGELIKDITLDEIRAEIAKND